MVANHSWPQSLRTHVAAFHPKLAVVPCLTRDPAALCATDVRRKAGPRVKHGVTDICVAGASARWIVKVRGKGRSHFSFSYMPLAAYPRIGSFKP